MEAELYLIGKTGGARLASKQEMQLIYGGIRGNLAAIAAMCATKPKAAYFLSRALAAKAAKRHDDFGKWKLRLQSELLGMELDGFKALCDGKEMLFGPQDIQIDNVILRNQYRLSPEKINGKIVVDAGANTGVFSIFAAKMGACRVYAFEPILENVELIKKAAERNGVGGIVVPVPMALGESEMDVEMEYSGGGDPSASLAFSHPQHGQSMKRQKVHVTTLDNFFASRAGEAPAFVKMDIEGFEEQALLGGRRMIAAHKPILSFSAYHKPTDKEVLPRTVKSIRDDYSCSLHAEGEEDFYCD